MRPNRVVWGVLALWFFFLAGPAGAASHQWRFTELFSNQDGSVQFIEMRECCGFMDEHELSDKWLLVVHAGNKFNFRSNLTGNTANRHLLLGTQAFSELPGAPLPDFIIPDGFLATEGDTLEYWLYPDATVMYGALPTDGITSLAPDGSTAVNSPSNYSGDSGSVDVSVPVQAMTWGEVKRLY